MAHPETSLRFEQPRSSFSTWLGIVLLFVVFALFVWVVVGAMPRGNNYEEAKAAKRAEKLKALHAEIDPTLREYAWVDKEKRTVRIPVSRAMELTMADLAQKQPAPAGPIAPAAAQPGPQATAPVAPSPAGAPAASPSATPHPAKSGKDSEMEGQADASANPPGARPGTQPGPSATPAAAPDSRTEMFRFNEERPSPTPVQTSAGTPIPAAGATPKP